MGAWWDNEVIGLLLLCLGERKSPTKFSSILGLGARARARAIFDMGLDKCWVIGVGLPSITTHNPTCA